MLKQEIQTLKERKDSIMVKREGKKQKGIRCDQNSVSGAVSQRACVYCGARVVLNPITDAVHIVHGPIGCASYTWDIRGSLSSGAESYRHSFSTDLREKDIIFGGEKKLTHAIDEIMQMHHPRVIFVYATCVVGVIGDDLEAVCRSAEAKYNIDVIPVQSSGFAGNKASGYRAAGDAILRLMSKGDDERAIKKEPHTFNYLGDFNLAGETWIIKNYFNAIGVKVIATITGDSNCETLKQAPTATHNVVQCAGSMVHFAKKMQEKYDIDYERVRFLGIEDTVMSLRLIAKMTGVTEIIAKAEDFIAKQVEETNQVLDYYRGRLVGKTVAIYVGGGFKAISLIKQFNDLGIRTVMVGTQTGQADEYEVIESMTEAGTVILDDANPTELKKFMKEKGADILVGGVKERPLAYKLGLAFIDHNHERKHPLCGFEGAINFAKEVDLTVNSPVWGIIQEEREGANEEETQFYELKCQSV